MFVWYCAKMWDDMCEHAVPLAIRENVMGVVIAKTRSPINKAN